MAERRLVCGQGRLDEELEFDEETVAGGNIQHFRRQVCVCGTGIASTLLTG